MEYRLGLYEKSMPIGLNWTEMLTACSEAGFDQLEISIDETDLRQKRLDWTRNERLSLLKTEVETGTFIRTMCLSAHRKYPLGSHDSEVRKKGMEIMRKAIEFSNDVGIRIIQLAGYDVYYEESDADTRLWFCENLQNSVDYAAQNGVMLGFETMETPFMDTISKAMVYVNSIQSSYLGVYPDLGNLTNACELYGGRIEEEIRSGERSLVAMHIKETVAGRYRDMDFGTGRVNFAEGIREAYKCGVRLFTAEFWDDGSADWQARLARSNRYLRKQFSIAGNME